MAFEKLIKTTLPKCPFCGEYACWKSDGKSTFFAIFLNNIAPYYDYTCRACGAVVKARVVRTGPSGIEIESFLIVDAGTKNKHSLCVGKTYSAFALEELTFGIYENLTDINGDIEDRIMQILVEKRVIKNQESMDRFIQKMKDPVFKRKTILKNIFWFTVAIGIIVGFFFLAKHMMH